MTYEMEYLMHLYSCGATGRAAMPPAKPIDWEKVIRLAVDQSITYTVALPIKQYDLGCPPHIRDRITASLRGAAVKNAMKTDAVLDLLKKMEKAGIPTLLIKGIDVARCYKNPECRVSADTDILVKEADEKRAAELLTREGFIMKARPETSNHAVGNHPTIGTLELHIKLISDRFSSVLLKDWTVDNNAFSSCVKQELNGRAYYSLEPTDNLIFLTFHLLKHFLFGGTSLRMMMDNALYAKENLGIIDCAKYEKVLSDSKFLYTMQIIFGCMVRYCGFEESDFPITPVQNDGDMLAVLDDLEAGGWQGLNNGTDGMFAWFCYQYQAALKSENKSDIREIRKARMAEYKEIFFPTYGEMAKMYPKLEKRKYLYPCYLLYRIFSKAEKYITGKKRLPNLMVKDESQLSEAGRERMNLFKKMNIIQ